MKLSRVNRHLLCFLNSRMFWSSQIAIGHDNSLRVRIYGTEGSIEWFQEECEKITIIEKDGKHYLRVNDYQGLRRLYGELLAEIQRITSEGDYPAAKEMVESYAVKVNQELHNEILARYEKLNLAPYKGFVNPVYTAIRDAEGNITDVTIDFTEGYIDQHLRYSRDYSPLPDVN